MNKILQNRKINRNGIHNCQCGRELAWLYNKINDMEIDARQKYFIEHDINFCCRKTLITQVNPYIDRN